MEKANYCLGLNGPVTTIHTYTSWRIKQALTQNKINDGIGGYKDFNLRVV